MKIWQKKSQEDIKQHVFNSLKQNVDFTDESILGIPASHLDEEVFSQNETFLKEAPFMSTMVKNPNHIGCHTLGNSEGYFLGTQHMERELIEMCAVDILKGDPNTYDGYVASGGTEANIQAIWVYRNYFMKEHHAKLEEICILCSEDSHYSMDKASNLLAIDIEKVPVDVESRLIAEAELTLQIATAKSKGKLYFIVVINMMTTMFGSVDDIDLYEDSLNRANVQFKMHVDAAFGGFYFPFSNEESSLNLSNKIISSFTLDAHKMAQAPYGTGIFLIRKGLMKYAHTESASYVKGQDSTLIGSRSGANAIAVWMILMKHGPYAWREKIYILKKRADWFCEQLKHLDVAFYRFPTSNIITIKSDSIDPAVVETYGLVPDSHELPKWYKIVVMNHVSIEKLSSLLEGIKATIKNKEIIDIN